MIIQSPDGSYEIDCPLAPAAARWLRALLRPAQGGRRASLSGSPAAPPCRGACPAAAGAPCAAGR